MNASARDRLEQALAKIADPKGEGARTCLTVYADAARAAADAADARAKAGISLGAMDGAIVSIKDLLDIAGEPTRAGSKILAKAQGSFLGWAAVPSVTGCVAARRLRGLAESSLMDQKCSEQTHGVLSAKAFNVLASSSPKTSASEPFLPRQGQRPTWMAGSILWS